MKPSIPAAVLAAALDAALVLVAHLLALAARFGLDVPEVEVDGFRRVAPLLVAAHVGALYAVGAYRRVWARAGAEDYLDAARGVLAGAFLLVAAAFYARALAYSRLVLAFHAVFALALLLGWRLLAAVSTEALWRRGRGLRPAAILGRGRPAEAIAAALADPRTGYRLLGTIPPGPGATDRAAALGAEEVFLAMPPEDRALVDEALADLLGRPGLGVRLVPGLSDLALSGAEIGDVGGLPALDLSAERAGRYYLPLKRAIDVGVALVALPLAALAAAALVPAIRLESAGPALFRQRRVGRGGRPFVIWKLRSMRDGAAPGLAAPNDPRVTRIGRVLRRWSIDETPQFWNVLCGEMSIVGPRPEIPEEVERWPRWMRRILEAPPGLTGLAQVSGRDDLSPEEKARLDLYYVRNRSLALDLKILVRTLHAVFAHPGRA